MIYTLEGTTKRYSRNKSCIYPDYAAAEEEPYRYGCEFEFYINTKRHNFHDVIDLLTQALYTLCPADILVDEISIPQSEDKNHCIQIKPDISLEDNGIEISVPISVKEGIIHYIHTITPLIEKFGYTNKETGFHIHMSIPKNNSKHIDFYRFMLLCADAGLLSSWQPRIGYSQNVMDILTSHSKQEARVIKTKKGTIWNLERIDSHHIEIKSIGGIDYHKNSDKMILELEMYIRYFQEALSGMTERHKQLLAQHKEMIENLDKEIQGKFAAALIESGILGK